MNNKYFKWDLTITMDCNETSKIKNKIKTSQMKVSYLAIPSQTTVARLM